MHLHRKEKIANRWFSKLMWLSILILGVASHPYATLAAKDPSQEYVFRMNGVLESLDEDGWAALATVRSNVGGITDDDWEDIVTVSGKNLQELVDGKIGNGKSKEITADLIRLIYGTKEGLESDVRVYRINYAPYFDTVFGDEHAVDELFAFLNESLNEYEARMRALLSGSSPEKYTSLDEVAYDAMRAAAEKTGLDQTLAKSVEISMDDFLTIIKRLVEYIDPD